MNSKYFLVAFLVIFQSVFYASAEIGFRLPTTVEPVFYSLKMRPNLDKGVFEGEVSISIEVKNVVKSVLLHSSQLTINDVFLDQREDGVQFELHPKYELMEIRRLNGSVSPGMHNIFIRFNGSLLNKHLGFYRATYGGNESVLAVTDFQPTYARQAFPCFDEPAFKARFQVTLITPNSSYTALSNMRRIKSFSSWYGGFHKFETSPVMSTYMLAFSINKYSYGEHILSNPGGSVPIRVYSFNASNENNAKALSFVNRSLDFFNNYTQLTYPLPKLDFIEYDRSDGTATENWGLVTAKLGILSPNLKIYREAKIANVLAHEVAHSWFGNLVTIKWWDDIWLPEGLAVLMALKAQEHLLSDNATWEFASAVLPEIYYVDQSTESSAVVSNVESPASIQHHFNNITYLKGAAILRMVEQILGEEVFRQALQTYLRRFQFKTACTNDFIDIVESFAPSDADIRGFLETYLYQKLFPIIKVSEDEKSDSYVLQKVDRDNKQIKSPNRYKWTIPIFYATDLEEKALAWFDKDQDKLYIPRKKEKWITFNYKETGFYRIIYNYTLWNKFYKHHAGMDALIRNNLLSEAMLLYRLDEVPCETALIFMNSFANSTDMPNLEMWSFANQAREVMTGSDEKTFNLLMKYINMIRTKAGFKKEFEFPPTKKDDEEPRQEPKTVPEKVKSCIKWINDNLPSKMNDEDGDDTPFSGEIPI